MTIVSYLPSLTLYARERENGSAITNSLKEIDHNESKNTYKL